MDKYNELTTKIIEIGKAYNDLLVKIHNELLERKRIKADKYEREDSFFGVMYDMANGKSMKDAFIDSFKAVYRVEISDMLYESCYHLCKGWD